MAQATGRATSARDERGQRGSEISAGRARPVAQATGRATSARDERGQRGSGTSASRSESVIRGGAREESARRKSQTLGGARYERREGIRGRPIAAGRPDARSCLLRQYNKGGGAFRDPTIRALRTPLRGALYGRHRTRTPGGTSDARRAELIYADLKGCTQDKGAFYTLTLGTGGV